MAQLEQHTRTQPYEKTPLKTRVAQLAGLTLALGLAQHHVAAIESHLSESEKTVIQVDPGELYDVFVEKGLPLVTGGLSETTETFGIGTEFIEDKVEAIGSKNFFNGPLDIVQNSTAFIGDIKDSAETRELLKRGLYASVSFAAAGGILFDMTRREKTEENSIKTR